MNGEVINGFSFGEFELDAGHRLLLKRGETVNLNPKTFDLLLALVQNYGAILSKNDLLDRVWENQFVEENNLTVHVAALRKALGETKNEHKYIVTVPGKGYSFVAELNDPKRDEIVVESHKFERIVVEEETEEYSNGNGFAATNGHGETRTFPDQESAFAVRSKRSRAVLVLVLAIVSLAAIGGYVARGPILAGLFSQVPFVEHRARQLTTNGKVGSATLSPDGKLFAYTIDDLGQKSLWLGYVDGGNQLQLRPSAEASYRSLTFSPDSSQLYFSIRDEKNPNGTLYKIPVLGGAQAKVLDEIGHFALSPDGKQVAVARRDAEQKKSFIEIVPLDGSGRRELAGFPDEASIVFGTLSWAADGKRLAGSAFRNGKAEMNEIAVVDIASGETTRTSHDSLREITKTEWLPDDRGLMITAVERSSLASVPHYRIWHLALPGRAA